MREINPDRWSLGGVILRGDRPGLLPPPLIGGRTRAGVKAAKAQT
jgi:hypothetical protein